MSIVKITDEELFKKTLFNTHVATNQEGRRLTDAFQEIKNDNSLNEEDKVLQEFAVFREHMIAVMARTITLTLAELFDIQRTIDFYDDEKLTSVMGKVSNDFTTYLKETGRYQE